jgi:hypothetical protein
VDSGEFRVFELGFSQLGCVFLAGVVFVFGVFFRVFLQDGWAESTASVWAGAVVMANIE